MPNVFTLTLAGSLTVIVGPTVPPIRFDPQPLPSLPSMSPDGPQPNGELSSPVKAVI